MSKHIVGSPSYWLSYLTKGERENLLGRSGNFVELYTDTISQFLHSRFKYLYVALTEKECEFWNGVIDRVEKQIKKENGK